MSDAWASPLAIHYLVNSSAGLTPLCVADVETGLEALQAGEGAGPAMYADSVRRKRKHKMNKHKHRLVDATEGWCWGSRRSLLEACRRRFETHALLHWQHTCRKRLKLQRQ